MSRSSLPCQAIQQLARLSAAVLLITLCTSSIFVLAGREAQATPETSHSEPDTTDTYLQIIPQKAAQTALSGQPVQAPIPSTAQAAPLPTAQGDWPAASSPPDSRAAQPGTGCPLPVSPPADDSWFADAAFVGDSRTEGLLLYSGVKAGGGFAYRGLTVQSARTDRVIPYSGQKMTAIEALAQGRYGKVYLMLGVNELGWYNDARYEKNYAQLIEQVRQVQPDAQIYLQTIIPVTAEKSASSYVNNSQVLVYNEMIAHLAQEKECYLVDVWSAFAGDDGALAPEGSVDGVHLTKQYYARWLDYLKTHTAQ